MIEKQMVIDRLFEVVDKSKEVTEEVQVLENTFEFESVNVKLHDLSYALYTGEATEGIEGADKLTEDQLNQAFEWFCVDEYPAFEEYLKENHLTMNHIGRTSSFYIESTDLAAETATEGFYNDTFGPAIKTHAIVGAIEEAYVGTDDYFEAIELAYKDELSLEAFHELFSVDPECFEDDLEDGTLLEDLEYFDEALDDFKDAMQTVRDELEVIHGAYEYLENYKENQVDRFKQWLKGEIEAGNIEPKEVA